MAHRALTLKYRPQVFADMVGQDHVSSVLMRALESGRVAHAYLFTGARGVGKTTAARILAKALNCERRAADLKSGADPCNACTSCTEITSGVSLDVAEIDGASNRGIADVQALRERVRFSPTGGRYRVVIIDEVHQLSNDAFAALLKTLEEPPPHLVFVFATTDPQKLPETIRSRCQRFDFARVPLRKVAERLYDIQKREQADADGVKFALAEGAAFQLARTSEGSMRDAVSALDQVVSAGEADVNEELVRRVLGIPDREVFFGIAGAIVKRDPAAALRALHEAFDKGLDARELCEGLSEHVRHILILKVDPKGDELVAASHEDVARLREQGEGWSESDLLRLLKIVSEAPALMRDSPQPLIHFEAAVMQMATLEPGETLAQVLDRLEALEHKLGGGPVAGSAARGGMGARSAGAAERAPTGVAPRASAPGGGGGSGAPRHGAVAGYRPGDPGAGGAAPSGPSAPRPASGGAAGPSATMVAEPNVGGSVAGSAPATARGGTATGDRPVEVGLPASDERTALLWREVIGRVNERKRMLGAFLEESRFAGMEDAGLVLETDDLHRNVIDERDNRALVNEAIREVFGHPVPFRCARPSGPGATRTVPTNADVRPMIEKAIEFFDGEIVDLNPRRENGGGKPDSPNRRERPSG